MKKANFLKKLTEKMGKNKILEKEGIKTINPDTAKSKLMNLLFKTDKKTMKINNPEEYYLNVTNQELETGIFKHIQNKGSETFKKIIPSKLIPKKVTQKEEAKQMKLLKSISNNISYMDYPTEDLIKHRYLLSKCLIYHTNHFNDISLINNNHYTKNFDEKPEEQSKRKKILDYYKFPEISVPQPSKTFMRLNYDKSIKDRSQSTINYKAINKISQVFPRIDFSNATNSLLVNKYISEEIDKISKTLQVRNIIERIDIS